MLFPDAIDYVFASKTVLYKITFTNWNDSRGITIYSRDVFSLEEIIIAYIRNKEQLAKHKLLEILTELFKAIMKKETKTK